MPVGKIHRLCIMPYVLFLLSPITVSSYSSEGWTDVFILSTRNSSMIVTDRAILGTRSRSTNRQGYVNDRGELPFCLLFLSIPMWSSMVFRISTVVVALALPRIASTASQCSYPMAPRLRIIYHASATTLRVDVVRQMSSVRPTSSVYRRGTIRNWLEVHV